LTTGNGTGVDDVADAVEAGTAAIKQRTMVSARRMAEGF
jgi:hypothetical protein